MSSTMPVILIQKYQRNAAIWKYVMLISIKMGAKVILYTSIEIIVLFYTYTFTLNV